MAEQPTGKLPHGLFGDSTPSESTRDRIVGYAQELFFSQGYQAIGLDQILREAGLSKATFYNHFESRDALIEEAIKRSDQQISERFTAMVRERAGWDPKAALLAMFDVLDDWFNDPDFCGCQFLAACMAFPNPNDPIHRAASAHYLASIQEVDQIARSAGIQNADAFAKRWVLLIEGAVAHQAITGDDQAVGIAKQIAELLLANSLPPQASAPSTA